MEIYSNTTRFALACNLSSKIIEPIQSRCAILRYSRVSDMDMLKRIKEIADAENINYSSEGLEALIFTAEGDMRQAINNMQSTFSGFGYVNPENVFKVCDQPHPLKIQQVVRDCAKSNIDSACDGLYELWQAGYSAVDIITTLFRVVKYDQELDEEMKLEFVKQIGYTHMKVLEGLVSLNQLSGLLARLCRTGLPDSDFQYLAFGEYK